MPGVPAEHRPTCSRPDRPYLFGLDSVILTPHNQSRIVECAECIVFASVRSVPDLPARRPDPALVVKAAALRGVKELAK
jgi:hypothetical protein